MSEHGQAWVGFLYIRPCAASPLDAAEQERRVKLAAETIGLTCGGVLRERAMSPRQRRAGLPMRDALLRHLEGTGGTLVVADAHVLGRNLPDLVTTLAEAEARGATVLIVTDEHGTIRPVSAADLDTARRAYVREAVAEGRAKARARGVRFGRPPISTEKTKAVRGALARGLGVRDAARAAGVGVATASRIRDAAERGKAQTAPS